MSDDPTQHEERARLVGKISFQWAYLEYLVSNVVWYLIGVSKEKGMIITGHLDIKPEIQISRELADHEGASENIRRVLKDLSRNLDSELGHASRRNLIVHGIYSSREGDPAVMVEAHKSKKSRERQEMSMDFLHETLQQLNAEIDRIIPALEAEGINVH